MRRRATITGCALSSHSTGSESGVCSGQGGVQVGSQGGVVSPPGDQVCTSSCSMALHTEASTSCWLPWGCRVALTFQALGSGDMESGRKEKASSSVAFPSVLEGGPSRKRVHKQHLLKQEY